jgi:2-dehydro-3-deoxyglucarate aldolase/4-hydroxy-2-oxoheptanedioate aldolase
MEKNRFNENLKAGKISLGAVITLSDLTVSELAGDCGMDFVWIDAEHAPHTIDGVMKHLIALRGTGCAGLVRVRANEPMLIKPFLDLAPDGVIIPMVNTPEEAEAAVAACRYPLTGIRGCGVRRAVRYGAVNFFDYVKRSEKEPMVIVQIEHVEAVRNLDKILKVPGIGSICVGPCDLSGSMGILNRMDDPELNKVLDEVCAKVKKAGLVLGTAAGDFPRWRERGVDWFAGTSDWGAMAAGLRAFRRECGVSKP